MEKFYISICGRVPFYHALQYGLAWACREKDRSIDVVVRMVKDALRLIGGEKNSITEEVVNTCQRRSRAYHCFLAVCVWICLTDKCR